MIGSGGDVLTSIRSPIRMEEYGHLFNVYFLLFLISLCCKCIAIFFKSMKGRWILHGAFERHSGQEKCCKLVLHYHNRAKFLPFQIIWLFPWQEHPFGNRITMNLLFLFVQILFPSLLNPSGGRSCRQSTCCPVICVKTLKPDLLVPLLARMTG